MMDQVVVKPTSTTEPAREDALFNDFVRNDKVNYGVDVIAFKKKLGLRKTTRESVQDETVIPIVRVQPGSDDFFHDFVTKQFPLANRALDSSGEFRMVLDVPTKDLAHIDMDQIEFFLQELSLRAFARSLDTDDDVFVHT